MNVALYLRAPAGRVAHVLEGLLLPDSAAVVTGLTGGWTSVHAEQLSEDLADIEELAAPLSSAFSEVWAHATLYYCFRDGAHTDTTHDAPPDVPLKETGSNPIHVLREADKPGLGEFFGRSADE